MLRRNYLREKLASGKAVIGTWAVVPSVVTIDIISSTGIDFIIIDQEHGPVSTETVQNMIMACESRAVSPIVRAPGLQEDRILTILDCGAHGVQVPNITTVADVQKLISYSKYPPIGKRGFSPFTRAGDYSIASKETLPRKANENILVAINVEGKEAILNIEGLLEIDELDILFIGLFDLSVALGIPGQVDHPTLISHLEKLTKAINDAGKVAGTIAIKKSDIDTFVSMGMRYIVYMVDCEMFKSAYGDIVSHFRSIK